MNTEAQNYLEKARSVKNVSSPTGIVKKATRYLTHAEREAKENELRNVDEVLSPANTAASSISQEGRAKMAQYRNFLRRDLAESAPPTDISGAARDELVREERELAEKIRAGMLTHEEMRRNPPGAVGRHMRWEAANKDNILAWKNLRRLNNPDDTDEDLANIEMLRPSLGVAGASSFMADAQIPGVFAMTPLAKERWPLGEPKIDTPLAQAERRELEELRERMAALEAQVKAEPKKERSTMSDEKRQAARERGLALAAKAKAAREAKLQSAAVQQTEGA